MHCFITSFSPFRNQSAGNQTEIIYSVFVDRKPVLAKTAADDMKLVTEDEVAQVMGKLVFIKAERMYKYLSY